MLEVRTRDRKGCLWLTGNVLSLGVLPLVMRANERQLPAQLTDTEMVLRNGKRIPWGDFTRAESLKVYLGSAYVGTRWVLKHRGGKVMLGTERLEDSDRVMEFILRHLPPQALQP